MAAPGFWKWALLGVCLLVLIVSIFGEEIRSKRNVRQRLRNVRNQLTNANRHLLLNMFNSGNESEWSRRYVPDIPSEDEIDCYIEVEVIQVVGGRCVRLAGARRMAVCQSGMYLDVRNNDCQYILAAREMEEAMRAQEQNGIQQTAESMNHDSSNTRTESQAEMHAQTEDK